MLNVDITKSFKHEKMSFSFELNSNRIVIFGHSGCGKTTLLKIIAGLVKPDSGELFFNKTCLFSKDKNINMPAYKRNFGYLPQENTLFPNMTVKENILYGLKTQKLPFRESVFNNIIDRLRIRHKLDSMPGTLSGGQMQRAALARVLVIRPNLLLLDEPFSALDTPVRECLRELVCDIADELNIPLLFVTHEVEDAFIVGKDIVVINDGVIVEYGKMKNLYSSPKYVETARMMDYKNCFPIKRIKDNKIELTNNTILNVNKIKIPADAKHVCIKTNNILLVSDGETINKENCFSGVVKDIHCRGRYVKVVFQVTHDFLLHIHLSQYESSQLNLKKGERAWAVIDQDSLVLCKTFSRMAL